LPGAVTLLSGFFARLFIVGLLAQARALVWLRAIATCVLSTLPAALAWRVDRGLGEYGVRNGIICGILSVCKR
jgi:hypothetical protein